MLDLGVGVQRGEPGERQAQTHALDLGFRV